MDPKKFVAQLKTEILIFLNNSNKVQAAFARNCGKSPINFNQWLNSKASMNTEFFFEIYVQLGGDPQDIWDALHKRQELNLRQALPDAHSKSNGGISMTPGKQLAFAF